MSETRMDIKIEGTADLTKAITDTFSPVSELLGSIGDRVRVYRQTSLLRCLKKAQELAQEEGLVLNAPPLKFLVPFLEDCSLEDPEEDDLIEMWARLLTRASSDSGQVNTFFNRVLREISSNEARLLKYMISPESHTTYTDAWHLEDVESYWYNHAVKNAIKEQIDTFDEPLNDGFPFHDLESAFKANFERPGSIVHFFDVGKGKPGNYPLVNVYIPNRHPVHDDFSSLSIALLQNLGLIGAYSSPDLWFGGYAIQVEAYYVTRLGSHFIESCTQEPVNSKRE